MSIVWKNEKIRDVVVEEKEWKMNKYLEQYQSINRQFEKIINESLQGSNLRMHAKASAFIDDYETWISLIVDSYEVRIYREALSEYKAMLKVLMYLKLLNGKKVSW